MKRAPFLLGIAGPSCSGKSELARGLAAKLGARCAILPLDAYYRDLSALPPEDRATCNFDHPDALDGELLLEHVEALAGGRSIEVPSYDFATHARKPGTTELLPARVVLLEGLFVLHWEGVRDLLDASIYVEAPEELCLARRIARDTRQRGRTRESVEAQFRATVSPAATQFLFPTRQHASLVLSGELPPGQLVAAALSLLRQAVAV